MPAAPAAVTFRKLVFTFANGFDKCLAITGWIFMLCNGAVMPLFLIVFGEMIGGMDPDNSMEDMYDDISGLSKWAFLIAALMFIICFIAFACMNVLAERIVYKYRVAYLKSVLSQDITWFDENNPAELSAKLSQQCTLIQKAVGEKSG